MLNGMLVGLAGLSQKYTVPLAPLGSALTISRV